MTSYYDWSAIDPALKTTGIFPLLSEGALRATLGILARTVEPAGSGGQPRGTKAHPFDGMRGR